MLGIAKHGGSGTITEACAMLPLFLAGTATMAGKAAPVAKIGHGLARFGGLCAV